MTTVVINDKWRIAIDEYNHTLERYNEGGFVITFGKGKGTISSPKWEVEGYYPNISQCLRRVVRLEALSMPDCTINDYLMRLERLNEEITI
jgi:hypothetical protein